MYVLIQHVLALTVHTSDISSCALGGIALG